jgi:hypothetical protein
MCKDFLRLITDRVTLQIYIRPVLPGYRLRALMDFADPLLIYPEDSKSEETFRFGGSRSCILGEVGIFATGCGSLTGL